MNWRKPLIYSLLYATGSKIPKYLKQIKKNEYLSAEQSERLANSKLEKLLLHASNNVPYYHTVLSECEVVSDGKIRLENFQNVPILTKEIIRNEGKNLYSKDYKTRKPYKNTSGGSTGEPVEFIQDKNYNDWNTACKIYFQLLCGYKTGQKQIKLWGSERDIFGQKEDIITRLKFGLFNIESLNSFRMSDEIMKQYVERINKIRPQLIWAYTGSIYELARFIKRNDLNIFQPKGVICTAETVTPDIREGLEDVFKCCILSQYGSREVGALGCQCAEQKAMHIFSLQNKVEILDSAMSPCPPGETGQLYITTLNNYSMPLIRYEIGDTAVGAEGRCPCTRGWPLIEKLTGRVSGHFKTKSGKIIHGEYFTHLFYAKKNIKRFRVIQKDYDAIIVELVADEQMAQSEINAITEKIKLIMGQGCDVAYEYKERIESGKSGKFLYTVCEIKE